MWHSDNENKSMEMDTDGSAEMGSNEEDSENNATVRGGICVTLCILQRMIIMEGATQFGWVANWAHPMWATLRVRPSMPVPTDELGTNKYKIIIMIINIIIISIIIRYFFGIVLPGTAAPVYPDVLASAAPPW